MTEIGALKGIAAAESSTTQRRARVREVSSRFMSPLPSSSAHHQQRSQRRLLEAEPEENRPVGSSSETPFPFHKRQVLAFKENKRPDTPITTTTTTRSRLVQHRSSNSNIISMANSAAAKLLQSHSGDSPNVCHDPIPSNTHNVRSSMPEADLLADHSLKNLSVSRSLNHSLKPLHKPPVPNNAIKPKKVSTHQDYVHSLRLLHNHYLQWRFANAKAEASIKSQKLLAERTLFSFGTKLSDLHQSVKTKRIQLGLLRTTKSLAMILEAQMTYLDDWSAMEEDYSNSLSEAIQALLNTSVQLPLGGNVRADIKEVCEAINCALKLMELTEFHLQSFMPKAEELGDSMIELAKVIGGEKALVQECGDLLSKTHSLQVEECSLRGQLIQLHQNSSGLSED